MDFRSVLDRAGDKLRSVFSRDNSFFYGTAEQEERASAAGYDQAPQQGTYPNAYQAQAGYHAPYQEQQPAPYPQGNQQAYQQPNPYGYPPQGYAPQPQYQQPAQDPYAPYQQPAPQPVQQPSPARGYTSPQQAQLQQQQAENTGRNRRAAQHQQMNEPQPESNVVPFPGAPAPEMAEARQMDAYVVNVTNINGCRQAMTCLRKGQCTLVVMDQLVDKAEVRRYVDMLNGACFALGGTMTRLSLKVGFYILAPSGMMVYTDPVTASANAQPRPQSAPAGFGTAQPYPYQQQPQPGFQPQAQPVYAAQAQPQYAPPQGNYYQNQQTAGYAAPGYNQQGYAPPQGHYDAGYEENRYAQ